MLTDHNLRRAQPAGANIGNIIDIKDNNVIRTMPIGVIQVTRGNRAKFMQFNNNRIAPKEHSNSVRQLGQKDLG